MFSRTNNRVSPSHGHFCTKGCNCLQAHSYFANDWHGVSGPLGIPRYDMSRNFIDESVSTKCARAVSGDMGFEVASGSLDRGLTCTT